MFGIGKQLRQVTERLEKLEQLLEAKDQAETRNREELSVKLRELRSAQNRHDMAIEDLLDGWEELETEQREQNQALGAALAESAERERSEAEKRETALLDLLMDAHDQLYGLRRAAALSGSGDWQRQLELADRKLAESGLPAGFQVIDAAGAPVNFALHEVVEVLATPDPEREYTVAEVYACGYVWRGRLLRKAKVSVWRQETGAPRTRDENREEERAE